jgi:hypothetical protein
MLLPWRSENDSSGLHVNTQDRKRTQHLRTAFLGVSYPTTLEETGSYLCWAYLTQLPCAFRLSQALDALFHPKPFPPCFMRATPLGFCLQRFSLSGSERRLTASPAPLVVTRCASEAGEPATSSHRRDSRDLRIQKVRINELGVTRGPSTDPLLALPLFEVFTPSASASCYHETSSLGLQHSARRRTVRRNVCSAEFQSTE